MGNQQIHSQNFIDENLENNFKEITSLTKFYKDPQFDEISVYKRIDQSGNQDEYIFTKFKTFDQKSDYSDFYQKCDQRFSFLHPNLLKFYGYNFNCDKTFCSTVNSCTLYYEYLERTLDYEIMKRHKTANYFLEKEIWYMLSSLVSVGHSLQNYEISHGDINPKSVFVSRDGIIKLGDHWLLSSQSNSFIKTFLMNERCYIAPELMGPLKERQNNQKQYQQQLMQKRSSSVRGKSGADGGQEHDAFHEEQEEIQKNLFKLPEFNINYYKNDVWSLGLTILEACTLISSQTCYNWDTYTVSYKSIQDLMTRVSSRYSEDLVKLLMSMLEEDPNIRVDFKQLFQTLKIFKQQMKMQNTDSQFIKSDKQNSFQQPLNSYADNQSQYLNSESSQYTEENNEFDIHHINTSRAKNIRKPLESEKQYNQNQNNQFYDQYQYNNNQTPFNQMEFNSNFSNTTQNPNNYHINSQQTVNNTTLSDYEAQEIDNKENQAIDSYSNSINSSYRETPLHQNNNYENILENQINSNQFFQQNQQPYQNVQYSSNQTNLHKGKEVQNPFQKKSLKIPKIDAENRYDDKNDKNFKNYKVINYQPSQQQKKRI